MANFGEILGGNSFNLAGTSLKGDSSGLTADHVIGATAAITHQDPNVGRLDHLYEQAISRGQGGRGL